MVVIGGFDTAQLESALETSLTKKSRKKALSTAGPLLLVVTFIEDGMRIFLRWGEQVSCASAANAARNSRECQWDGASLPAGPSEGFRMPSDRPAARARVSASLPKCTAPCTGALHDGRHEAQLLHRRCPAADLRRHSARLQRARSSS
eukprot:6411795-Prymnesium_polylepis.1